MSAKSKNIAIGRFEKSGTSFSSKAIESNIIETSIFINNKQISVKVGYGQKKGQIIIFGKDIDTGAVVGINKEESNSLNQDLQTMLLSKNFGTTKVEKVLIRTFNLLSSWPSSLAIMLDPTKVSIPSKCGITYPDGISDNICRNVDEIHTGQYVTNDDYCGWAKYYGVPILKLDEPTAWMENVQHLAGGADCFGRCGKGCIGDGEPNNSLNIYTQDCFDHDLCAENEGVLDAGCNWMFIYAIDDFFYGPTCPSLDLVFVMDTTGSMWDDIAKAKGTAIEIVNAIDNEISDYRVAIVDYKDFPKYPYGYSSDYTYHAVLPFSTDKSAIINSIQNLSVSGGGDWQEAVNSALTRAIFAEGLGSWRNDVKKSIIVIGDAPPHKPEQFTGYSSASTADVPASVAPVTIYTISIGANPETIEYFSSLSKSTGGQIFTAPIAQDIADAVTDEAIGGAINSDPVCSGAVGSITKLWPPDQKMSEINILNVQGPEDGPVSIVITGITQDEPVSVSDVNTTLPDGEGIGTDTAFIRAERSGKGNGRVYNISFKAYDDQGGECSGNVLVGVPHDDRGINTVCIDDGQFYDSTTGVEGEDDLKPGW